MNEKDRVDDIEGRLRYLQGLLGQQPNMPGHSYGEGVLRQKPNDEEKNEDPFKELRGLTKDVKSWWGVLVGNVPKRETPDPGFRDEDVPPTRVEVIRPQPVPNPTPQSPQWNRWEPLNPDLVPASRWLRHEPTKASAQAGAKPADDPPPPPSGPSSPKSPPSPVSPPSSTSPIAPALTSSVPRIESHRAAAEAFSAPPSSAIMGGSASPAHILEENTRELEKLNRKFDDLIKVIGELVETMGERGESGGGTNGQSGPQLPSFSGSGGSGGPQVAAAEVQGIQRPFLG